MIIAGYRRAAGLLSRAADVALLAARLALGWFMLLHGLQKLRAPGGVAAFQHLLIGLGNVPFPALTAVAIPWIETVGGIMVLAGALTRLAALVLAGEMAIIIPLVKLADLHGSLAVPSTSTVPSTELEFLYLAGMLVLLVLGPGRISLDAAARLEPARRVARLAGPVNKPTEVPSQSHS